MKSVNLLPSCQMWGPIQVKMKVAFVMMTFVVILMTAILLYGRNDDWRNDSALAMSWEGFGPERGLYNFTVVTAMIDIGRGSWGKQTRSYNTYLLYMQRVLRLDVNMLIFIDKKGKPFVDWMRRGRENRTKVVLLTLADLPYYSLKDRIAEIMSSSEYQKDNELVKKNLCESYIPEYDILQLSKLYLMNRAFLDNPFNTTYFMWMDAGYGRGHDIHPAYGVWIPRGLFEYPNQITFIERDPGVMVYKDVKDSIHKMSINILPGGFFAGGGKAFQQLFELQQLQMKAWMRDGVIDDDQTMYMLLYYQKPELFHLVKADWYDVFKLFNSDVQSVT